MPTRLKYMRLCNKSTPHCAIGFKKFKNTCLIIILDILDICFFNHKGIPQMRETTNVPVQHTL